MQFYFRVDSSHDFGFDSGLGFWYLRVSDFCFEFSLEFDHRFPIWIYLFLGFLKQISFHMKKICFLSYWINKIRTYISSACNAAHAQISRNLLRFSFLFSVLLRSISKQDIIIGMVVIWLLSYSVNFHCKSFSFLFCISNSNSKCS